MSGNDALLDVMALAIWTRHYRIRVEHVLTKQLRDFAMHFTEVSRGRNAHDKAAIAVVVNVIY